jgi:hypothetical protein
MTTHNDWRTKYTARLRDLWRQERDAGSQPETADLETASQQDFIALAQRSKGRRNAVLEQALDKALDKAAILTDDRRADLERECERLAAKHTDPEGVRVYIQRRLHPDERLSSAVLQAAYQPLRDKIQTQIVLRDWCLTSDTTLWQATHPEHGATSIYVEYRDLLREIDRKTPPLPMENARSARPPAPEAVFADE